MELLNDIHDNVSVKDDMDSKRERNHSVAQEHQEIFNQGRLSLCTALVDRLVLHSFAGPREGFGSCASFI